MKKFMVVLLTLALCFSCVVFSQAEEGLEVLLLVPSDSVNTVTVTEEADETDEEE